MINGYLKSIDHIPHVFIDKNPLQFTSLFFQQENRSIVAAIESVRKNMQITCPLILQVTSYRNPAGESEFESSYFILIEETAIPVDGDFSRALELLIQCYYTLEISYPSRLHGVYRLLEYFYGIQSMRRTSCFIQFIDILEKCPT